MLHTIMLQKVDLEITAHRPCNSNFEQLLNPRLEALLGLWNVMAS